MKNVWTKFVLKINRYMSASIELLFIVSYFHKRLHVDIGLIIKIIECDWAGQIYDMIRVRFDVSMNV